MKVHETLWKDNDEVRQRLEYELSVIKNMGYSDYYLIVWILSNTQKTMESPLS